jgi:succinate-semialdehyde dehydrogenase/glutarate-semialdehyde dehydrogenase
MAILSGEVRVSRNHVGGEWIPSHGDDVLDVTSPVTGQVAGKIPAGTSQDAAAAVNAAKAALPGWRALSTSRRGKVIALAVERLTDAIDELAELQHLEMGQPVALAKAATTDSLNGLLATVENALGIQETTLASGRVVRQPRGVAALIVPWNFPIPVALDGLGPLLATGNTVVWKPSERSPLSAVRAMETLVHALPPGVVNLVLGDRRVGEPLVTEDTDLVLFTGSVAAGRRVGQLTGQRLIKAVLELGGKDPVIIDEDVDPEWAALEVARGAFHNAGQLCTSMERIYVHEKIVQQFVSALVDEARRVELGPLVDPHQRAIVEDHVADAVTRGARILTGGDPPAGGSYYPPTVLVDVPDDAVLIREETFGPIAPVIAVPSFESALRLADASTYGLAATVFTRNDEHARAAADVLNAGTIWLNEWARVSDGSSGEPKRSSGLGAGWGPGLLQEVTTATYIHQGPLPPAPSQVRSTEGEAPSGR